MVQKCHKEKEITKFIEKYSLEINCIEIAEMKRTTKALSRDEYEIKT
jgi:hypothetical protein